MLQPTLPADGLKFSICTDLFQFQSISFKHQCINFFFEFPFFLNIQLDLTHGTQFHADHSLSELYSSNFVQDRLSNMLNIQVFQRSTVEGEILTSQSVEHQCTLVLK